MINETLLLETYEDFKAILLPVINNEREQEGLTYLSEEEAINLFLDKRKQNGMDMVIDPKNS